MSDGRVTEYVRLLGQIAALDADVEVRVYARLDELWYGMTDEDRIEVEKQLAAHKRTEVAVHDGR